MNSPDRSRTSSLSSAGFTLRPEPVRAVTKNQIAANTFGLPRDLILGLATAFVFACFLAVSATVRANPSTPAAELRPEVLAAAQARIDAMEKQLAERVETLQPAKAETAPVEVVEATGGVNYQPNPDRLITGRPEVFAGGDPGIPRIAITIDDGPHGELTGRILDVLGQYGVKATFFVVGKRVEQYPEMVRRILAEGHELGNHTYDDQRLDTMKTSDMRSQIVKCEDAVRNAAGYRMSLLRPPGMRYDEEVLSLCDERGYVLVSWGVATNDYVKENPVTPERILKWLEKNVRNGSILLMHDSPIALEALPAILQFLQGGGFDLVRVSDLITESRNAHWTSEINPSKATKA